MQDRERALDAYRRREWREAYDALCACNGLTASELDLLADSAHWVGLPDETIAAYQRAYELHLADGDGLRAALSAFMTAIFLRLRGEGTADKIYCVSRAEGAEAVREHARCGGFPANVVAEVMSFFDPTTGD